MFFKIMMRLVTLPFRIIWGLSKLAFLLILPILAVKAFKLMLRK